MSRSKLFPDRDKLVLWEGGGYPGCLWEPNIGFFDSAGYWNAVYSTGSGGRRTKEEFAGKRKPEFSGLHTTDRNARNTWVDYDIVLHISKAGMLAAQANLADGSLYMRAADALAAAGYPAVFKCGKCGKARGFDEFSGEYDGYRGNGGVGIIYGNPLCADCYDSGRCEKCNEYCGADDVVEQACGMRMCGDCVRQIVESAPDEEAEKLERLEEDIARMQAQVEEYCRLVPHAAEKARKQADKALCAAMAELQSLKDDIVTAGVSCALR